MMPWRAIHVGFESDGVQILGLEVWKHCWRQVGEPPPNLPHPSYPNQAHPFYIYEVAEGDRRVRFAAGELSNGVWGFYVPD